MREDRTCPGLPLDGVGRGYRESTRMELQREKGANKFLLGVTIFFMGGERGLPSVRRQRCAGDMMVAEAPRVKMVRPRASVSHPAVFSLSPQGSAMRLQRLEGK